MKHRAILSIAVVGAVVLSAACSVGSQGIDEPTDQVEQSVSSCTQCTVNSDCLVKTTCGDGDACDTSTHKCVHSHVHGKR